MADVEASGANQPFCAWTQDSRKFEIHISAEIIGTLATESLVAFKRVPRRGLETGGILLGRTEVQGATTIFWIEGFGPIESEHRFGPSYLLSDSDFVHLQTELARNGTASLGIYRSQTRSEQLAIENADVGLLEKSFGVSDSLFLMLAPQNRVGAFYFRENGISKCVHQFNLVSSLSTLATHARTSPQVHFPAPQPAPNAHRARSSADPDEGPIVVSEESDRNKPTVSAVHSGYADMPSKNTGAQRYFGASGIDTIRQRATNLWREYSGRSSRVTSWILATVAVALVSVLLLSAIRRSAATVNHSPKFIYLTVERAGPSLRLLWDGNSSAVRAATRAVLHIQDGDQQTDRELLESELLAGQFTYTPQHSGVTFRLNVYAGEPNATGMVQVLFPSAPIAAAPAIAPAQSPRGDRLSELLAEAPSTQPTPQRVRDGRRIEQLNVKPAAQAQAIPPQSPATFTAAARNDANTVTPLVALRSSEASKSSPPAVRDQPTQMSPPAAHGPSSSAASAEAPWHSLNAAKKDTPPPGRELNVRASTMPVHNSGLGTLLGKIPLLGHLRKQAKPVEAAPVYQPKPIVRMIGEQQLIAPVAVGVKVYVSVSGAVNDAEVVDYGDNPPNFTLANAALAAARNWRFAPSHIDDAPVASQMIIRFLFSP